MDENQWNKASEYALSKTKLSIFQDILVYFLLFPIVLLLYPLLFFTWNASSTGGIFQCAFISVVFLLVTQIPGLFLDWYKQFSLEERFGFNKSPKLWVTDKIKRTF